MGTEYKTHVNTGDGPLCGSNSFTACVNSTDCDRCNRRVVDLLELLSAAADGNDVQKKAEKLMQKWRFVKKTYEPKPEN